MSLFTIATRESRLALWQAEHVKALLEQRGHQVALLGMTTRGDQILDRALSKVGGKGLFVKELEVALEEGRADLAVHSLKDVPMELPAGFELACVMEREDPRDALVSGKYATLAELPQGAVVGTSSLRRVVLLRALRPDLKIEPLRGNLDTRLRKLDDGQYDAIVLASAGLKRLGLGARIRQLFEPAEMLPAAGQGALGIEIREADHDRPETLPDAFRGAGRMLLISGTPEAFLAGIRVQQHQAAVDAAIAAGCRTCSTPPPPMPTQTRRPTPMSITGRPSRYSSRAARTGRSCAIGNGRTGTSNTIGATQSITESITRRPATAAFRT